MRELRNALGVTPSALSLYINGHRIPARDVALRLADLTGVPLENILDPARAEVA